jgi:hypothetical protein
MYNFYLFACIAYFQSLSLGTIDFKNPQVLDDQEFEQQLAGSPGK